jgi:PAS domain S-box-containing protein
MSCTDTIMMPTLNDTAEAERSAPPWTGAEPDRMHWLLQHMAEGYYRLDRECRFIQINAAAAAQMQRRPSELIGKLIWDEFPTMREMDGYRVVRESMASGQPFTVVEHWEPVQRWFEVRGFPEQDGLTVFLRDISAQRLSEQLECAVTQSEQRFRCLFDLNPSAALAVDLDGCIVDVNQVVESLFGHAPASLIGQPLSLLMPEWGGGGFLSELLQSGASHESHEVVGRHALGRRCELSVKLIPTVVQGRRQGYFLIARDVTKQRRRQRQLKVQAEVIDRTHDAVVVLDEAGRVQSWNEGATRLYGCPGQSMMGQPFEQLFDGPERTNLQHKLAQVEFDESAPSDVELRLTRPHGEAVWLLLSLSRIAGIDRGREMTVIYGLDVTPRRLAEDALRQALAAARLQAERMSKLSRAAVDISRRLGRRGLLQYLVDDVRLQIGAHLASIRLTYEGGGASSTEAASLSAKHAAWRHLTQLSQTAGVAARVVEHGTPTLMTQQQLENHPCWVPNCAHPADQPTLRGWLAAPLFGRDGKTIGLLQLSDKYEGDFNEQDLAVVQQMAQLAAAAVETDAALQRAAAAESRAQAQLAFSRSVADSVGDALYAFDRRGALSFVNPAGERLFELVEGGSPEEALKGLSFEGRTLKELVTLPAAGRGIAQPLNGAPRHFHYVLTPLHENAACTGAVLALSDVTEQRRLAQSNEKLVLELSRSNRELQDFAFIASHDLQEPMRKIQAFADRLESRQRERLDDEGREYLGRVSQAAQRMRRLLDDLLNYARISSRSRPFEPVELDAVLARVLGDLEAVIQRSGALVVLETLPNLQADPAQMHHVFLNLLSNALKFSAPGEAPRITVSGKLLMARAPGAPADERHVEVQVRDAGIGFDQKHAGRIFQPFQRLHGRGHYEGSGIGLAIVKKVVERHRGSIEVRSSVGQGSTFIVRLPHRQPDEPTADAHSTPGA